MRKVIFIGHRDLYFGAESVMFRIIAFLQKNNLALPEIVLPTSAHSGFRDEMSREGMGGARLLPYKLIGGGFLRCVLCLLYNIPAMLRLVFAYRKINIDYVYTNTSVNILGAMVARALNKAHIWHFHEQPTGGSFKWIPKGLFPIYRYLISRPGTVILFISRTQKELWEKEFNCQITNCEIIYTPAVSLPVPAPAPADDNLTTFGFMGSFTFSKNLPALLSCFAQLRENHPLIPCRLVLMGEGEAAAEVTTLIHNLQLSDQVIQMGHSLNVLPFYAKIDVLVLPSFFESWGLVVLEAISQQKATIITSNTGLKEILKQDEDCIFVDPFDKDQLYKAMENLLLNPAYRKQLARHAYHTVQQLQLSAQFDQSVSLLFT